MATRRDLYGDASQLNDASVSIRETRKGAPSSRAAGQFTITFMGATTPRLQIGASIEDELESLKTVGDVAVATHEDVDQMSYLITFTSLGTPANLGNLPLLRATRLALGDAARVSVRKISTGCCDVALSFNNGHDWHSKQGLAHGRDSIGQVVSLEPSSGPVRGGTSVDRDDCWWWCLPPSSDRYGASSAALDQEQSRARIDQNSVECLSPAIRGGERRRRSALARGECDRRARGPGVIQICWRGDRLSHNPKDRRFETGRSDPRLRDVCGENFNRRCRFDVEAPPAVYKLPERFVSVSTKAYAVNASHVTCQAPPLSTYNVEDASVVRAKVFVLENGVDPSASSATLWYAPSPRALTVYPSGGPRSGGSSVRMTTDWNETEWSAAQAAGALDDAVCDFGDAGVVPASYASRDILECVAPSLEPKRALHTVEVSSAAITSSIQEVEVRLNTAGEASGSFTLMLEGHVTRPIPMNASDLEVQQSLNALPSVGFVTVLSNSSIVVEGGSSWFIKTYRISFRTREGPTPTLIVDDSELVAGSVGDAVRAYAVERGTTGDRLRMNKL